MEEQPPDKVPPDPTSNKIMIRESFPPLSSGVNLKSSGFLGRTEVHKFDKYLQIDFGSTNRRHINPYQIKKELEDETGEEILELTGNGKTKMTIKTRSAHQTKLCLKIETLVNKACSITRHPFFNCTKGLIRLRQFDMDDMQEFKEHLSKQYDIENIEKASFLKSKDGSIPYLITFNQEAVPYSVYIPGEISDSVVSPFGTSPMLCKKCFTYGHTLKNCKNEAFRCKKCSELGHKFEECNSQETKCHHCPAEHPTGHRDCPKYQEEKKILDIIQKEKVTTQRAKQILNEKPTPRMIGNSNTPPFPSLFDVSMPKGTKRTTSPWFVEKIIQQHTGKLPRRCRGKPGHDDTYVIEVGSEEEAKKMSTLRKIGEHEVDVQVNNSFGIRKGLIYIQGYDLLDFDSYKAGLIKQQGIATVENAYWIKSRNNNTQALILGFQKDMPEYLDIPGEAMRTKVLEYKKLPNLCKKCLEYGHSKKICREINQKCNNCTSTQHYEETCQDEPKCEHCTQNHRSGSRTCQRYKVEQEVLAIQAKSRVSRVQAFVIYNSEHPNAMTTNYAAVTATSIPHVSTLAHASVISMNTSNEKKTKATTAEPIMLQTRAQVNQIEQIPISSQEMSNSKQARTASSKHIIPTETPPSAFSTGLSFFGGLPVSGRQHKETNQKPRTSCLVDYPEDPLDEESSILSNIQPSSSNSTKRKLTSPELDKESKKHQKDNNKDKERSKDEKKNKERDKPRDFENRNQSYKETSNRHERSFNERKDSKNHKKHSKGHRRSR